MEVYNLEKLPPQAAEIVEYYFHCLKADAKELVQAFYITGSAVLGDFYDNKSDLDFIAILKQEPETKIVKSFREVHRSIGRKFQPVLNGMYMSERQFEEMVSTPAVCPMSKEGWFYKSRKMEMCRFMLFNMQQAAVKVYGEKDYRSTIHVSKEEVYNELHQNVNTYWKQWLWKYSFPRLKFLLLLFFPRLSEWGVLGIARQYYTLSTGAVTSKTGAGEYMLQQQIPEDIKAGIVEALEARKINDTPVSFSYKRYRNTLKAMRYIRNMFNEKYSPAAKQSYVALA